MQHLLFTPQVESSYRAAILIKETSFRRDALEAFYVRPLAKQGVPEKDLMAFSLKYQPDGKAPAAYCLEYLNQLLPALDSFGVTTIMVADNSYYKKLTGLTKTGSYYGYVVPCKVKGFEHINVVLCPNHSAVFHNPAMEQKIDMAIKTLAEHCQGTHVELGTEIINYEYYPKKVSSIAQVLQSLHAYPVLSADIEAFSLKHWAAGIGTISFAWDQHNGIAFPCDYESLPEPVVAEDKATHYGKQVINHEVRLLLREFFESYKGRLIWHNMAYDAKVIIYSLWMDHVRDYPGLLKGMEFMTRNGYEDTKIIAYLATNSCAGNNLGLKDQAHEFAGNYAQEDIEDIRLIPLDSLLKYNLVDSLATWYVHDKHRQTVIDDQQEELYQGLMKKSIKMLLQVELTGMPLNMKKVAFARRELEKEIAQSRKIVDASPVVADFEVMFRKHKWEMDYRKRRDKAKHPENIKYKDLSHFDTESFNPNSNPQLQSILYEILELPVLDYTKKKQPATGAETLEKLINHTSDPDTKDFLANLITFFAADKILGTFILAFEQNSAEHDGWHYLFGNFNLGGTVSGRLSSSSPNLQNLPSKGKYGKLIKDCFEAPPGWLWCGADFASLEDRISALTTKDPNKLAVYTDGYDGHCLRAFNYFGDQMTGIDSTPSSINSIKKRYEELRDESKAPTFLLTYQGTFHGLMKNLGWAKEKALRIEKAYHDMYRVSDEWVADKIKRACRDGYVTVAFGLRVRTPLLKRVVLGTSKTPFAAEAEGRTAGNALGQSYCLLNNRAGVQLQEETLASEYAEDIQPAAHIHDAQYFMVRDNFHTVQWLNEHLGNAMKWQELPEIQHPEVKLSGELDIFYPSWKYGCTIPNGASIQQIYQACNTHLDELKAA